jgi:diguanylate cyclase (GGDEF)-like protein
MTRREAILGLAIPVLVIAGLVAAARTATDAAPWIAFLAVPPLVAAMFARVLATAVVSVLAVAAAAVSAAQLYGVHVGQALPVLIGVIVCAGIAVLVSQAKDSGRRAVPVAARPVPRAYVPEDERDARDPVTGLPTRAALLQTVGREPHTEEGVVAIIDCDGLAAFNERHGRDVGDTFLFAVGGRTSYALADQDVVARGEGDELLVIMRRPLAQAEPTLREIAGKVNDNPIRTEAGLLPATLSLGAAAWEAGEPLDAALAAARRALYSAKLQGPGTIALWPVGTAAAPEASEMRET